MAKLDWLLDLQVDQDPLPHMDPKESIDVQAGDDDGDAIEVW